MEHPGLSITQIKNDMTLDEIQTKIVDLRTRMGFAYRMNNQPMSHQLEMMLEVYSRAQNEILDEMYSSQDDDHGGQIDVS